MNACHFISGIRNTFLCALTLRFIDLSSVTGLCRIDRCKDGSTIVVNNVCKCDKCRGYWVGDKCGMYVCCRSK